MAVPETQGSNVVQVADVDTGVINWINADLVTHICPRVWCRQKRG